jgi:hypothetical protein
MAHAYTPGLRVADRVTVRKNRILPLPGKTLASMGDRVEAETIVARTDMPGKVFSVNAAGRLGIPPGEVAKYMIKKEGDNVEENEIIAESKSFISWLKATCFSPIKGSIESISTITGQVLLREPPNPLEVPAYIDGKVVEVMEGEGVVVETVATFVQGIFGVGGEAVGPLELVVKSPDEPLTPNLITKEHRGKILVGGSVARMGALEKAVKVGAKGIVVGGLFDEDLKGLLGYDLGVAITGSEKIGLTLVITEGFSEIDMAQKTFELLKNNAGAKTSINGATQIRAGVLRPEIIIPRVNGVGAGAGTGAGGKPSGESPETETESGMEPGDMVRIIREPYFGVIGRVEGLPVQPQKIETETKVRVVEIRLPDNSVVAVPRANVEMIQF